MAAVYNIYKVNTSYSGSLSVKPGNAGDSESNPEIGSGQGLEWQRVTVHG